ncbi:MAG TPA: rhodanese-like domain-containing protein [Syntrophales bacterium]|nr:rhodanese-like domain-containing protein [Syntrophales bacterium]
MRKILCTKSLIVISLLLSTTAFAATNVLTISTSELKSKLDANEKFLLVNVLSDIEFNMEHIPGSINIPMPEIKTSDKLPQDKESLIVVY